VTGQSFREVIEFWEPEDIMTALIWLDERNDEIKDAQRGG
jgi:hypothetical protein